MMMVMGDESRSERNLLPFFVRPLLVLVDGVLVLVLHSFRFFGPSPFESRLEV